MKSDLYIASDLTNVAPKPVITNMYEYAQRNIPNYQAITEIPSGHLPTDINTSLAQDWNSAFNGCSALTSLPEPFYDTSNAITITNIFRNCSNITVINGINFCNAVCTNLYRSASIFPECLNLTTISNINLAKYNHSDTINGIFSINIFAGSNITTIKDCYFNSTKALFRDCEKLENIQNITIERSEDPSYLFYNCRALSQSSIAYVLNRLPNTNFTNMRNMFYDCRKLTSIPNFNTSNVTDMRSLFVRCYNLISVPNFDTGNVTNMSGMFLQCNNLSTIPILNLSSVTYIGTMYQYSNNIKGDLYIESNNVTNAAWLFNWCSKYTKNIYCHANTTTYNTIYANMNNNTYNSDWNAYLLTMEDNYAYINTYNKTMFVGSNIATLRFPTNKVEVCTNTGNVFTTFEVIPYRDYYVREAQLNPMTLRADPGDDGDDAPEDLRVTTSFLQLEYKNSIGLVHREMNVKVPMYPIFRFFNGIENSTAYYSLL